MSPERVTLDAAGVRTRGRSGAALGVDTLSATAGGRVRSQVPRTLTNPSGHRVCSASRRAEIASVAVRAVSWVVDWVRSLRLWLASAAPEKAPVLPFVQTPL
jgi:hypothetical protein